MQYLDPYRPGRSLIHQLDPRVKFVLAIAYILTTALTPPGAWPVYTLLLALALAVVILSELGVVNVFRKAVLALPFVLAALPVIFTLEGPLLLQLPLGAWTLTISTTGVERFASIALKSWLSVQMAIVLAATTPFSDLMIAMRALKMPRLLVAVFGLMWRYLFVLADEALRLLRARQSRSGESELPGRRVGGGVSWRARVAGGMAGNLFLRAFERSDRIYMAMLARGYDGEVRATPLPRLNPTDWLIVVGFSLGLAALLIFGLLL